MISRWRRAIATMVGLWFAISVSGVALQLCPQHSMRMMAGMHQARTDCNRPGDPSEASGRPHDTQHQGSHDDCTCTGMCCVAATVTLAAAPLVLIPVVEAEAPPIPALGMKELAPRAAPDVTLPPPLGPPTLRA